MLWCHCDKIGLPRQGSIECYCMANVVKQRMTSFCLFVCWRSDSVHDYEKGIRSRCPSPPAPCFRAPAFLFCTTRTRQRQVSRDPTPCSRARTHSQPPPHPTLPNPSLHQPATPHHDICSVERLRSFACVVQEWGFYTDPPATPVHAVQCPLLLSPVLAPCLPHLAHASPLPLPSFVHDLQLICRERSLVVECVRGVCLLFVSCRRGARWNVFRAIAVCSR